MESQTVPTWKQYNKPKLETTMYSKVVIGKKQITWTNNPFRVLKLTLLKLLRIQQRFLFFTFHH